MNKSYKIVYSKARKRCVVVSEIARAFAGRVQASRSASVSALMTALGAVALAGAMPVGAKDISGSGTVDAAGTLTIKADLDGDGLEDSLTISGIGAGFIIPTQTTDKDKDGNTIVLKGYGWRSANASATLGHDGIALGTDANAQGVQSIAIGTGASVGKGTYWGAVAIGWHATATGANAIAIGDEVTSAGGSSIAMGNKANAAYGASAFGEKAIASGKFGIAIGHLTQATAESSIAIGNQSKATNLRAIAFGLDAIASGESSYALGSSSTATEDNTVSVGSAAGANPRKPEEYKRRIVNVADGTKASDAATLGQVQQMIAGLSGSGSGTENIYMNVNASDVAKADSDFDGLNSAKAKGIRSLALGEDATAMGANSVAVGRLSEATDDNTFSVGSASIQRRITNVAAGTNATDAATVSQTATVEAGSGFLTVDGSSTNGNGSKKYKISLTTAGVYDTAKTGLVTNEAVREALAAFTPSTGGESDYLSVNASNDSRAEPSTSAKATGGHSTAVGEWALATGEKSRAFGYRATAEGIESIAIGTNSISTGWGSSAIGANAQAKGHNAVAFGDDSKAEGSSSIAFGSNASASYGGIAVGFKAVSTAGGALALGRESVANEANTVSVGRALGDVQDSDGNDLPAFTRRIVNVAAGTNATDAATVSQTATVEAGSGFLTVDGSSTNGNGSKKYKLSLTTAGVYDTAKTGLVTNEAVREALAAFTPSTGGESDYLSVNASNDSRAEPSTSAKATGAHSLALGEGATVTGANSIALGHSSEAAADNTVSVGSASLKRRITNVADGTKASDAATVGQLQTVSKKAGEQYLFLSRATYATSGITNNELSINASDVIASGTTALATVKAVYDETRPTADGTYVKTSQSTAANLTALDKQVSDNSSLLGYLSVNAADDALTAVPSTSAKAMGAHSLALGEGAAASEENALALGSKSVASEKNTVSVGSAATGLTRRIVNVASGTQATDAATVSQTATVESSSGLLAVNGDEANSNGSKKYVLSLKTGDLSESSEEGLVTNTTVKTALQDYAKADASNITSGSENQAAWLNALGTESVASGSKMFITSGAVYKEVRVDANGNYVRVGNTAAENLVALDDQAKKNADAASKAQTTAESAVDKAKKAQTTAEEAKAAAKKAQNTAETAKTDADKAQTTAEQAKDAAKKAQATAEKAEDKADKAQTTAEKAEAKADKAQTTAEKAEAKADKAQATAEKAEAKADKAQATAEKAEAKADKAQATAEKAEAKADKAQTTAEKAEAKADKAQTTAEKAEAKAEKAQTFAEKAETKADKAQTTAEQAKDAAKKAQSTAERVDEKAAKAQTTAEKAQTRANEAMAEARKHTKVTASGGLQVTRTDGENGATYDVSIAEDADFTAKQTTWRDGGSFSTANSSGFFSGGASAENADAYMSKGVVSAGTDAEKKIVLDGNTGKATFGKTVTIDGTSGKISGLAAGEVSESSTDAVNGAQLYEVQQGVAQNAEGLESLGRAVNKVDRKIDRTGALAAALAGLHPQDYDEDHPVSGAVGIGHYKGKQALAVGMFVRPVENFMVSLGASGSSDDYMLNAGASFRFGGPTLKKSPQQMAARLSDQEVTIRDLSAQNQAQKTRLESQDEKLAQQASEIEKLKALVADIQKKLAK